MCEKLSVLLYEFFFFSLALWVVRSDTVIHEDITRWMILYIIKKIYSIQI
jgi:hypothetical protein